MVESLMSDEERVNPRDVRIRPGFWPLAGLAVFLVLRLPGTIKDSGVVSGVLGFLLLETVVICWAYKLIKPCLTVWSWIEAGEFDQRKWSPEERGFQRGRALVYLYGATNADSSKTVTVEQLKQFGGWTFEELDSLLDPLEETGIVDVRMPAIKPDDLTALFIEYPHAQIRLTATGILATEDAVTLARQRPGYSVTIHGNDNQVQVATVNSEQLRQI
jgi:hypothetical protein